LYGRLHVIVTKLIASLLAPKALILDYGNIKTGRKIGAAAGGWGKYYVAAKSKIRAAEQVVYLRLLSANHKSELKLIK
jgi:hypothetical protein